jgi:hypothetical protein
MNRLVIIGNGFDLAHGLPTSYGHFIDDFWSDLKYNYKEEFYQKIIEINKEHDYFLFHEDIKSYEHFIKNIDNYCKENGFKFYKEKCLAQKSGVNFICFKNNFFLKINNESIVKWVDIENEYYRLLKEIANEVLSIPNPTLKDKEQLIKRKKAYAEMLNKEFEEVKNLLEIYLVKNINQVFDFKIVKSNEIIDLFEPKSIYPNTDEYNNFLNQFPSSNRRFIIEYLKSFDVQRSINIMDKFFEKGYNDEVLILDFNYTPTTKGYLEKLYKYFFNPKLIKIHGELMSKENQINFGFGDEYDEDYKLIENINENEFLKHIKSFKYLDNTYYRQLMNFVFKKEFQVYVMGHSCGLSDRTLLQTIFEHENCLSIKPYYYINEKGIDDYSDIVYNISRNFKNKIMMRDKIVDKSLCDFLPQNIRFKKINKVN